jgi:hypothetical protein
MMTKTDETVSGLTIWIDYTNHRGERHWRKIAPTADRPSMWWGRTEWHVEPQWLLDAYDHEKGAVRTFAMKDIHGWRTSPPGPDLFEEGGGLTQCDMHEDESY